MQSISEAFRRLSTPSKATEVEGGDITDLPPTDKDVKEAGESLATDWEHVKEEIDTLDLVFAVDCTGSMGAYISAAQDNIRAIAEGIAQAEKVNVRFGLVCYRDHPPQDSSYVTRVFPFTSDLAVMRQNVDTMTASGGGDGPEAVADGLYEVLHMPWRQDAAKVAVLIADAPPHGLGENGDGFPNGCPHGHDPLAIARQCADMGITIYSVGCEPALSQYHAAKDFFISIAELAHGQALVLESASLLAQVIMGTAQEEITLTRLQKDVQAQMAAAGEGLSEEAYVELVERRLQERKVQTKHMRTDAAALQSAKSQAISACTSMAEARAKVKAMPPSPAPVSSAVPRRAASSVFSGLLAGVGFGGTAATLSCGGEEADCASSGTGGALSDVVTKCEVAEELVSREQVVRMVRKGGHGLKHGH